MIDDKCKYEEAGRFHRYILNWRHAALAGFLVAVYAVGNVLISLAHDSHYLAAAGLALLSALLSVGFFFIDQRNRKIYITAVDAARALENETARESGLPPTGLYTRLYEMDKGNDQKGKQEWHAHTIVLTFVYFGSTFVLLILAGVFICQWLAAESASLF